MAKSTATVSLPISRVKNILYECEIALFAGGNPVEKMDPTFEEAIQVITELEQSIQ